MSEGFLPKLSTSTSVAETESEGFLPKLNISTSDIETDSTNTFPGFKEGASFFLYLIYQRLLKKGFL